MSGYRCRMSIPFGFGIGGPGDPNGPGGGQPGGQPFDMANLGAALQQLGAMLQSSGGENAGPVNWTMVRDVARQALVAAPGGDPSVPDAAARAVSESIRLADVWLDEATTFPATLGAPGAWSRSEWLEQTLPMWQRYVQPIAEHMAQMVGSMAPDAEQLAGLSPEDLAAQLPEELRALMPGGIPPEMLQMLQPMLGLMRQLGAVAFSMQLGQSLAALAQEVVSAGDIGIPLLVSANCALVPRNVEQFGEGIGVPVDDVRLYLSLRESAHQRLFAHVPWLRGRMVGAIEEYARGITVDPQRMQEAMAGIDMSDPSQIQQAMASGLLQPEDTEEQRAALARLETLLALVEGWVDDVVTTAIAERLPSAGALQETMRRRRAAGGPAERTFATLVGMELRPRALREAATVFAVTRERAGIDGRDGLWAHPDLLPDATDLAGPLGFLERQALDWTFPEDENGGDEGHSEPGEPRE